LLSWSHAVSGSHTALLVGVAVEKNNPDDSGLSARVTDNGTPMTLLNTVHDNNRPDGFLDLFGLAGAPDGTNAIAVTLSGGIAMEITGGSESFSQVSQSAPFGTPVSAYGSGRTPSVTAASTAGDLIAGFAGSGSTIYSAKSPSVSRYIANEDGSSGAGNSAGATRPGKGSPAAMKWSAYNDWWGAVAVEVLAG
jgi:hypothetical protein